MKTMCKLKKNGLRCLEGLLGLSLALAWPGLEGCGGVGPSGSRALVGQGLGLEHHISPKREAPRILMRIPSYMARSSHFRTQQAQGPVRGPGCGPPDCAKLKKNGLQNYKKTVFKTKKKL